MNKKGFGLIETVVVVVVLTTSLLLLYSSFNKILQNEKIRVDYDDVNYIYRTWYIKNMLESVNFKVAKNDLSKKLDDSIQSNKKVYFITIGSEYNGLFDGYENKKTIFTNMLTDFDVSQLILIKNGRLANIKSCTKECAESNTCAESENCNSLYTNLSESMISYLQSMNVEVNANYILIAEYTSCPSTDICHNYYGWVGV